MLDPDRRAEAAQRAWEARREAADLRKQAAALIAKAKVIERTWSLPAQTLDTPPLDV